MDIFQSLIVYVVVIGVLVIVILWDQARIIKLKSRVKKLEKYIGKYNISLEDDDVVK